MNTPTNNVTQVDPVAAARLEEAADWLLRLKETPADEAVFAQWMDWCAADPENLEAYEQIKQTWLGSAPAAVPRAESRGTRAKWFSPALAATLLVALALPVLLYMRSGDRSAPQSLATPIALHSDTKLPDGSHVTLGAASRLTSNFSARQRLIKVEAGEAFFDVAKDPQRPFIVQAGELNITAIGTAFNVRRGAQRIVVTVEEGTVALASALASGPPQRVTANQQIVYSISNGSMAIATVDPTLAVSWQKGVFKYVREPLADVVADLNRYSNRQIVIADPTLAQQRYTGTVFGNHIEDWLSALETAFPVSVMGEGGQISIAPRSE